MLESPSEAFCCSCNCICNGIEPNSNVGQITEYHTAIFLNELKRGNSRFLHTFLYFYRQTI